MYPAQLLEACSMDPETLLRLTREGWLQVSPAEPQGCVGCTRGPVVVGRPRPWFSIEARPQAGGGVKLLGTSSGGGRLRAGEPGDCSRIDVSTRGPVDQAQMHSILGFSKLLSSP